MIIRIISVQLRTAREVNTPELLWNQQLIMVVNNTTLLMEPAHLQMIVRILPMYMTKLQRFAPQNIELVYPDANSLMVEQCALYV